MVTTTDAGYTNTPSEGSLGQVELSVPVVSSGHVLFSVAIAAVVQPSVWAFAARAGFNQL